MAAAPPLVLDNGTSSVKCGCAGVSPLPLLVCPTVVGYPNACTAATTASRAFSSPAYTNEGSRGGLRTCTSPYAPLCDTSACFTPSMDAVTGAGTAQLLQRDVLCGDDLAAVRGDAAQLTYPMRNGVVQNMPAMQQLWDHVLGTQLPSLLRRQLGGHSSVDAAGCVTWASTDEGDGAAWLQGRRLLLCEPPNLSLRQRCDVLECFFESYALAHLQAAPQGVLALFANGAESGVVVECGEGLCHCTPIVDGCVLTRAQRRCGVAGRAVSERLGQLLDEQGGHPAQHASQGQRSLFLGTVPLRLRGNVEVLRRVKERHCFVARDAVGRDAPGSKPDIRSSEMHLACETNALQRTCVLPDGTTLRLGQECFTAPEVLFHPQHDEMDGEGDGVADALWQAMEASDIDVRAALYGNITLSGGTTLLPGFADRLDREMRGRYLTEKAKGDVNRMSRCPIKVKAAPRRQYAVYMGGALMAELTQDQQELWLSRSAYEEGGASVILAHLKTAVV